MNESRLLILAFPSLIDTENVNIVSCINLRHNLASFSTNLNYTKKFIIKSY